MTDALATAKHECRGWRDAFRCKFFRKLSGERADKSLVAILLMALAFFGFGLLNGIVLLVGKSGGRADDGAGAKDSAR